MKESLLKKRMSEAPRMEPRDAVKLIYQNEFGCGHLFLEEAACTKRIQEEIASVHADPDAPSFTLIGNRLCRLNLHTPSVRALPPRRITQMMQGTIQRVHGSREGLEQTLKLLEKLAQGGQTPFSVQALREYLTAYRREGCPTVSHSPAYRAAYAPAYRVVLSDYALLLPLLEQLEARLQKGQQTTVVLDGFCGAGKTTLAELLSQLYQAPVIHMDDFFLPYELRTQERFAQKGGNIHYERFEAQVLPYLGKEPAFPYQRFHCADGTMLNRECAAGTLRIVEGSYSLHPRFLKAYEAMNALTVFLSVDSDEQLTRLALRSPDKLERFRQEWIPLEKSYFQAYDIPRKAKTLLSSLPWEG